MTWLTWRQFRVPAGSVFAGVLVVLVILAITGPELVGRTDFSDQDTLYGGTIILMYLLPAVIGVFWGVPLVTRELETGTHSLVWNQSITRKRWLTTKMGLGVLAAMVAGALVGTAVTWWASPIDTSAAANPESMALLRISPVVFAARGIVPIGYAAFAFVLGVAIGILLRRTVAAMAVTLVVFVGVMIAVPLFVRPYILPPLQETVAITESSIRQISGSDQQLESIGVEPPAGSWVLADETIDSAGNAVFPLPDIVQNCLPGPGEGPPPERGNVMGCMAKLGENGYEQRVTFQPGYRFWPLQWIELAFFLALSALLTWFCFRRLRHLS
jgi:ABC-type transport system involved in multi-copper enzyme maturation permease subunit